MATIYGVTPAGYVRKPLAQIIADVTAALQGIYGQNIDVDPQGQYGQEIATLSAMLDERWQSEEAVYDSMDPDNAEGPRLVSICGITGTVPKTPSQSTVIATAIGTNGSPVIGGTQFQVSGSGPLFKTSAAATIATLAAWAGSQVRVVDDLRTNDSGKIYRVIAVTGDATTASSGGPTGTGQSITDHNVIWAYMGSGAAAVNIPCVSVDNGAIVAAAFTLTVIATPVAGLASVNNAFDAVLGQVLETDPQLRLRRIAELSADGEGGVDSMRAALLKIEGVTAAEVLENTGDTVDGNGLPAHSVEAVVLGGADADVAAVVFTKGCGIATAGATSATVVDGGGNSHTVNFQRPTALSIYLIVHIKLETDSSLPQFPVDGDAQIANALLDFADGNTNYFRGYSVSDDVITSKLYKPIEGVPGIHDVVSIFIGTAPSPASSANIAIGVTQRAVFDATRISVVHDS